MTQRVRPTFAAYSALPFDGKGYSIYGTVGTSVEYRGLRAFKRRHRRGRRGNRRGLWVKGPSGNHDLAAASIAKTTRIGSGATPAVGFALPSSFASQTVTFDVRHFKDNVENETDNFRTVTVALDANLDIVESITGTATLLSLEQRAAGVVRIRFAYLQTFDGTQPATFDAIATAGPRSEPDQSVSFFSGQRVYTIDTPELLDTAPYTYTIRAETAGGTQLDLLTGISVQADATGPPAAFSLTTSTK